MFCEAYIIQMQNIKSDRPESQPIPKTTGNFGNLNAHPVDQIK